MLITSKCNLIISIDLDWTGEDYSDGSDVKLDSATGIMPGICFTAGSKKVSFSVSVDYLDADFDVETSGGWSVVGGGNTLDMSGVMIRLGVILRF